MPPALCPALPGRMAVVVKELPALCQAGCDKEVQEDFFFLSPPRGWGGKGGCLHFIWFGDWL